MIAHSGPVTVQHGLARRTITITLPGHDPIRMTRRNAHRVAYDLQDLITPAPRTNIADIAYKNGYGAGRNWIGDVYITIAGERYTLDDEHQAERLLAGLANHLGYSEPSRAARAMFFAFINLTVAAVIAAIAIGTFYGIQALYHLAGGR